MINSRIILVVLGLVLAGAAAGYAARGFASTEPVLPFSAIQASAVQVEPEAGGTSATLRVTTSIDAVCSVAYGETEALGQLATDQDMRAGPHRQHAPLLRGLKPNATYFYRFQGTGVDGRLYQSPTFSFRTTAGSTPPTAQNLAIGARVVEISSEFSAAYAGALAVDGSLTTEWSSRGDGNRAFITIDLGRPVRAGGVAFVTRAMSDGSAITRTFSVTVEGKDSYGPFPAASLPRVAPVDFTGQVIRFSVVESSGGNTGAVEVQVYGRD